MTSPMPVAHQGGWPGNSQLDMSFSNDHEEVGVQYRNVGLKVHYTFDKEAKVNCLARYPHSVEVQTVPLEDATVIGVVDLRTCIQAVTECSPELAGQEGDYTIYALDYSEPDTPLVGQGMLSWAVDSMKDPHGTMHEQKLVTGRITKNVLAVFGRGSKETLEVKLKLTAAAKIERPECQLPPMDMQLQIQQHQAKALQSLETAMTPAGAAEWNSFIGSNPQFGQPPPVARVDSPAPSIGGTQPASRADPAGLNKKQQNAAATETQQPSPAVAEPQPASRPSSRTSNRAPRRKQPTGRPRGRPRKNPIEGNTSGYEDGTEGEEGPTKKRAKTTQVDRATYNTFGTGHDSLRVAASTSGSIRTIRPVAVSAGAGGMSHLQEVPRAPTPVPDGPARGRPKRPLKPRLPQNQSTMSQDNIPQLPPPYQDGQSALSPDQSQADARSPESLAQTPAYSEDSPGDIGSSPPVPRVATYPRSSLPPSSPILPPMPPPRMPHDASFATTTELDDLFEEEPMTALEEAGPATQASKTAIESSKRLAGVPVQVFQMRDGPNGKEMVDINNHQHSRSPSLAPKAGTPPLPLLRQDCADTAPVRPRADKTVRMRSPPMQGPTPPPTTDAAEKPVSPMPTIEPAQAPNGEIASQEASVTSIEGAEESNVQSFRDGSTVQPDRSRAHSSVSTQESGPSTSQPALETLTTETMAPEETSSVPAPEPLPSVSRPHPSDSAMPAQAAKPPAKPSSAKPRQPRQICRSQSAGPLVLPSIPASEPAGPSSLSQSVLPEPKRPKSAAPSAIRRSASLGPLCLPIPASDPVGPTPVSQAEAVVPQARPPPSVPASDPVGPAPLPVVDLSLPELHAFQPPPSSPPFDKTSNKNIVKKYAIKQRLEEAIMNGEMPPFCGNCGAIETPTWRKIWVREFDGAPPEEVEFSEKPGRVTATEVVHRDEENKPTRHRIIKKSLGPKDVKSEWKELVLCNPCGIWLSKNNSHRPQELWEKAATRRGQGRKKRGSSAGNGNSRAKKARVKSDAPSALTSEAYLPTDALGPVDPSSPNMGGVTVSKDVASGQPVPVQLLASIEEQQTVSNPGSVHSRGGGTVKDPIDVELDNQLGSTRRVLFPSPKRDGQLKILGELNINIMQADCPAPKDLAAGKTNAIMEGADAALGAEDDLEALFRSPAIARPCTPPPNTRRPEVPFETPTRSTPNHRPVTRSVSRSIRASRSLVSPVRQALFQRTPTKTPRSVRRSPRNAQDGIDGMVFDSPVSRAINQLLSEANGLGLGEPHLTEQELDLAIASLPALATDDGPLIDFGNLLSTDAAMPSSPPKGSTLGFDYAASTAMWAEWDVVDQPTNTDADAENGSTMETDVEALE